MSLSNCLNCKKDFKIKSCLIKRGCGKYCTRICKREYLFVKKNCVFCGNEFQGYRSIVEKRDYCSKSCVTKFKIKNKGFGFKKGYHPITEWKVGDTRGEKSYNWKGDRVGYTALHDWVKSRLGKAFWCTWCFSMQNIDWANLSHEYKRDLNDWIQLCRKCHKKLDKGRSDTQLFFMLNTSNRVSERRVNL